MRWDGLKEKGIIGKLYFKRKYQNDKILKLIRDYSLSLESIRWRSSGSGWKMTYEYLVKKIRKEAEFKEF